MRHNDRREGTALLCGFLLALTGAHSFAAGHLHKLPPPADIQIEPWMHRLEISGIIIMLVAALVMLWVARLQGYIKKSAAELQVRNRELSKIATDLEESERRFRDLFECSPDPIFVEDMEGRLLDVNPAACKLHNLSRMELLSKNVFQFIPETLHPLVKERRQQWRNGEFIPIDSVTLTADGKSVPIEIRAGRIDYLGQKAFLLHARDTTRRQSALDELRRAKEFSENLIRTANVLIIGLDSSGRIEIFNEAAERTTGYAKAELAGRNGFEILVPKERFPQVWGAFHRLTAGSDPVVFEGPILTKSGEERLISWQSSQIFEDKELRNMIAFGMDLTDRRQEEESRDALERKILDMQKLESLGLLAGGIAHDFNNLLTAILGNASLARTLIDDRSDVAPYLDEIERTSLQAADLCKQMLVYSGRGALEISLIDLNHVIEEMKHLLLVSVAKKAELHFNFSQLPLIVHCDVTQVRQIILNLVINASESITANEGTIQVTTSIAKLDREFLEGNQFGSGLPDGKYAVIEVADSGCGMSAETKAKIFDPFFTTKFTGRGLGLAVVQGIVRGHQGLIDIDSDEGMGTTFTIYLPCAEVSAPVESGKPGARQTSKWEGKGLILVIDDEDAVRVMAERALTSIGFTVLSASNGREGVEIFRQYSEGIVAVLLDMTMPHLDGRETFPEIRVIRHDVPVLFMSGYTKEEETHAFDSTTDFLQKPFQFNQLREKLRALVDGNAPAQ